MPSIAAAMIIKKGTNPFPTNTNIGPGHAPASAQPRPKIVPPIFSFLPKANS